MVQTAEQIRLQSIEDRLRLRRRFKPVVDPPVRDPAQLDKLVSGTGLSVETARKNPAGNVPQAPVDHPHHQLMLVCSNCRGKIEATIWCRACCAIFCSTCWDTSHQSPSGTGARILTKELSDLKLNDDQDPAFQTKGILSSSKSMSSIDSMPHYPGKLQHARLSHAPSRTSKDESPREPRPSIEIIAKKMIELPVKVSKSGAGDPHDELKTPAIMDREKSTSAQGALTESCLSISRAR